MRTKKNAHDSLLGFLVGVLVSSLRILCENLFFTLVSLTSVYVAVFGGLISTYLRTQHGWGGFEPYQLIGLTIIVLSYPWVRAPHARGGGDDLDIKLPFHDVRGTSASVAQEYLEGKLPWEYFLSPKSFEAAGTVLHASYVLFASLYVGLNFPMWIVGVGVVVLIACSIAIHITKPIDDGERELRHPMLF